MPRLRQILTVALPAVLAACSEPAVSTGSISASVEWRLAPDPAMTIGYGNGPEHAFGSVVGGLLLDDEHVAIAEGMSGEIRVFSSTGVYRSAMGGTGSGPGEFRRLHAIAHGPNAGVCGWDVQLARVTCFANNGDLLGTTTLDLDGVQQLRPTFVGVFDDGSIIVRDQPPISGMRLEPEGERRDSMRFLSFGSGGSPVRVLASAAGEERVFYNRDRAWGTQPVLFGRNSVHHLERDRLLIATNDSLELRLYASSGEMLASVFRAVEGRDVDAEWVERARASLLRSATRSLSRIQLQGTQVPPLSRINEEVIGALPHRSRAPVFDEVRLDHAGRIWLAEPRDDRSTTRKWIVLGDDFVATASVVVPAAAEVLDIGVERILLRMTDELDIPSVQLYRLILD